jgi:hypothetical protein
LAGRIGENSLRNSWMRSSSICQAFDNAFHISIWDSF